MGSNPTVSAKKRTPLMGCSFFDEVGFEEAGHTDGGAKKCPVDTFLGRGRIHVHPDASVRMWTDVHNILKQSIIASIVFVKHKRNAAFGRLFFMAQSRDSKRPAHCR